MSKRTKKVGISGKVSYRSFPQIFFPGVSLAELLTLGISTAQGSWPNVS
jgi:hypothetical protein